MSKTQKIWLGVFLAMFLVPEILWSPVGNFVYDFIHSGDAVKSSFRGSFLQQNKFESLSISILSIQVVFLILSAILVLKSEKISSLIRFIASIFLLFGILVALLIFYALFLFNL